MSDDDAQLMLAFKRGDYNAFAVLVERYQKMLIQFFYTQCPDAQLAEDCAQEVWRKVFRAKSDYVVRAQFKTFLFRVAKNYWIDVFRSRVKSSSTLSLDAGYGEDKDEGPGLANKIASNASTPLAELSNRDLKSRIEAALQKLSASQKDVFVLAEFQGMKYAEISDVLEIPVGTVKSRMFNAVRRLRELLKSDFPGELA